MEKSIYVQSRKLGNFYWRYNADEPRTVTADSKYTYASMNDLVNRNPDISFRFTVIVFEGTGTVKIYEDLLSWGFQCFYISYDFEDEWIINNNAYKVRRYQDHLNIRRSTDQSFANELQITKNVGGYDLCQLCGYYSHSNFELTNIAMGIHIVNSHVYSLSIRFPSQPDIYISGTSPTLMDLAEEIFDNATPTPPTPTPTPADVGEMWLSNSSALEFYMLNSANMQTLRKRLWQKTFLDLFSQYNNKASMIPVCMIYPIKINPYRNVVSQIVIGDNEYIQCSAELLNDNQKQQAGDAGLVAEFHLTEFPKTNTYLDYPTVTEYKLFLPFIGFINIDFQYLNRGLSIYYHLDYATGYCVCNINSGEVRINEFDIQLGQTITLAGGDNTAWKQGVWGAVGAVASLGIMAVTGNIFASTATYSGMKNITTTTETPVSNTMQVRNPKTNRLITESKESVSARSKTITREYSPSSRRYTHGLSPYYVARSVSAFSDLAAMELGVTLSSTTNPNSFINSYIHPFLLIRRPTTDIDIEHYKHLEGRPLNNTRRLIDLTGYTEVGNIHLDIEAFEDEISEIEELLTGGVVINAH